MSEPEVTKTDIGFVVKITEGDTTTQIGVRNEDAKTAKKAIAIATKLYEDSKTPATE